MTSSEVGPASVRQFIMKDAYSFDVDAAGLDVSYQKHHDTYCRIFEPLRAEVHGDRCPLWRHGRIAVAGIHGAHSGGRGPDRKREKCNYAANMEKATSKLAPSKT